ncbi:MAG: hypothetical protein JW966_16620 [Anaerolineae bacterium]|nr:hypothetical protein [Anaerolineae bacterium]
MTIKVRWAGLSLAILILVLLSGCIQPVDTTETPTTPVQQPVVNPTAAGSNPPIAAENPTPVLELTPNAAVFLVQQFLVGRGIALNNMQIWYDQPRGPDQLFGFSFSDVNALPCAGFLLATVVNGAWQPNNGALVCAATPDVVAQASISLFATSDGQPYTIVFGRVENPAISALTVVYTDNSNQTVAPTTGGFLLVAPGILDAANIVALDAGGNTIIASIPTSPAS